MTTFVNAVVNQEARTENGMKARKGTANACCCSRIVFEHVLD